MDMDNISVKWIFPDGVMDGNFAQYTFDDDGEFLISVGLWMMMVALPWSRGWLHSEWLQYSQNLNCLHRVSKEGTRIHSCSYRSRR